MNPQVVPGAMVNETSSTTLLLPYRRQRCESPMADSVVETI
jgi:hypothetical protein